MFSKRARRAVRWLFVPLVACVVVPSGGARAARAASSPPNVLIVLTDDQRFDHTMSVMPHTRRWFGDGGTYFPDAFATTPLCCPSRATIFSGRYAHNHAVTTNDRGAEDRFEQRATIQAYLHHAGYETGVIGKYFNKWDVGVDPPYFDRWAIESPSGPTGYSGGTWNVNGTLRAVDMYSTNYIARRGVAFIDAAERDDTRPWFLELSTFAPHRPAVPATRYATASVPPFRIDPSMRERDRRDKPPYVRNRPRCDLDTLAKIRANELRTLMSVDDLVQRVFLALRADGELSDTLAFFLSDNGTLWGAHGIQGKQTPYLPSVRIPMFARWPGHFRAGVRDARITGNLDVAPTVVAAAGVTPDVRMDGRSLLDASTRSRLLLEYWRVRPKFDIPTWAATFTKRSEYIEYHADDGSIVFREYYDLRNDPWQLTNLLHDGDPSNDPGVARLNRRLARDRTCAGSECP